MSDALEAPFARLVDSSAGLMAASLRLFAVNFALVRNFHRIVSIPIHVAAADDTVSDERGHDPVIDVERDGRVGIDFRFGSITFEEEPGGTYAVALVDVLVATAGLAPDSGTRVQMNVKLASDPDEDSILAVTERLRAHIVTTLRAAADTLDLTTARTLLFQPPETS